ncbi:MAG: alpha/beta fold hydrolase [Actinomycetota bacterium]|nr:alpha/beta fold hydrolase [Actinomycetota bacterium]
MTEELAKFIAVATNLCEPHSVASLERVSLQRRDSQCCAMRRSVAGPLVIVAGVVVAAPRLFKRAWRPPQRDAHRSPTDLGLPEEQVWLTGDNGIQLHGRLVPVDVNAPGVVVLHGWGGNAADMLDLAPALHKAGFHALFLDVRNHGLSEHDDHVSMLRFAEDLGVAVAYLRDREDVTDVAVIGHSVGVAASIYYASYHDDVSAVVAVASFAHPGEFMNENIPLPRPVRWAVLRAIESMIGKGLDAIAPRTRIAHVDVPVLLVHGEEDDVVPLKDSLELQGRRRGTELLVVPNGGHSDLTPFEPYFPRVVDFISSHVKSASASDL